MFQQFVQYENSEQIARQMHSAVSCGDIKSTSCIEISHLISLGIVRFFRILPRALLESKEDGLETIYLATDYKHRYRLDNSLNRERRTKSFYRGITHMWQK